MKIEGAKNNPVDKKETKNVFKTESSVFHSNLLKTVDSAPTVGAFARILEETRKENEKDHKTNAKADAGESESRTAKSEKDEKIHRSADEKKETKERNERHGGSDAQQNGDENQTSSNNLIRLQSPTGASDSNAPAARSILHVADLERIVSTIRTETFQNQKQITIALKNSILQGLQIKLTLTENGKVKAEFLAAGEQIKKQLRQRKNELKEILGNRSALFSEVEIGSPDADGEK